DFKPRSLIKNSNVKVVCTTDDPASDLHYHELLAQEEQKNGFKVLPAMRPDKAFALEAETYRSYLKELGSAAAVEINDFDSLVAAFKQRFEFFKDHGGSLSDHGLNTFHFVKVEQTELNQIVTKAINNEELTQREVDAYSTGLIEALMKLNKEFGWTMQYHINALRSANKPMLAKVGTDAGFDSMGTQPDIAGQMMDLLTDAQNDDIIPKTILYS